MSVKAWINGEVWEFSTVAEAVEFRRLLTTEVDTGVDARDAPEEVGPILPVLADDEVERRILSALHGNAKLRAQQIFDRVQNGDYEALWSILRRLESRGVIKRTGVTSGQRWELGSSSTTPEAPTAPTPSAALPPPRGKEQQHNVVWSGADKRTSLTGDYETRRRDSA